MQDFNQVPKYQVRPGYPALPYVVTSLRAYPGIVVPHHLPAIKTTAGSVGLLSTERLWIRSAPVQAMAFRPFL